jgi:hypothetical protein
LSALTDVIQDAAKRHQESFPTTGERRRFIETARRSLAHYGAFKEMPDRTRRAWLTDPVDTDAQEQKTIQLLLVMAEGITKQTQGYLTEAKPIPARLRRLARCASLILKGIDPDSSEAGLIRIERDLLKLYNVATAAEQRDQGKEARQKHLNAKQVNDERLQGLVVRAVSTLKDPNASQNARAKHTLLRLPPRDRIWKSTAALIRWAQRRKIVI